MRSTSSTAVALAVAALAAPAAAVAQSPDAVDRNRIAREAGSSRLMSPDAKAANQLAAGGSVPQRRSSVPQVVEVTRSEGLDAGDVAIGAGGAIGFVLLAGGAVLAVSRRRGPEHAA